MSSPIVPVLPVLFGLAVLWAGTGLVLYSGGRMRGRTAGWERLTGSIVVASGPVLPALGITAAAAGIAAAGHAVPAAGGLVLGTVIGSVLARPTLILGLGALARATIDEPRMGGARGLPFFLAAILLLVVLSLDGTLARPEGGLLLTIGVLQGARRIPGTMRDHHIPTSRYGVLPDPFLIAAGLAAIAAGAWFLTRSAVSLSDTWGVASVLPGLLVLGVGVSLPDLVLGLDAATKGRPTMSPYSVLANGALGLLAPLGLAALIHPITLPPRVLGLDIPAAAAVVTALGLACRRRTGLSRRAGGTLVACFLVYAAVRIVST
jgi:cation:H+ antiporter